MRFSLVDQVLEHEPATRLRALKQVTAAEEYLADHFPGYPILPGVFMLEAMVQAARELLEREAADAAPPAPAPRWVLGEVRNLRYGAMVRPGDALVSEVAVHGRDDETVTFAATARVRRGADGGGDDETAASGRFTMRPVRAPGPEATSSAG